jgi:hypothetical protein
MIMPSPLRDMPRPRRQRLPQIATTVIGVSALAAVLMITFTARSPSTSAMPIAVPTLFRSPPPSPGHSTTRHVERTQAIWQLRHHFPLPRHARQVRTTLHGRAFSASGHLPDLVRFYERRLRHGQVHWHGTDRTTHRRVIARVGSLTVRGEPVGYLAVRRTDVGLGIVVRFRS